MALVQLVNFLSVGRHVVGRGSSTDRYVMNALSTGRHVVGRGNSPDRDLASGVSTGKVSPNELKDMTVLMVTET